MGFKFLLLDITIKTHKLITHTKTRKKVNHNLFELFCLLMQITHRYTITIPSPSEMHLKTFNLVRAHEQCHVHVLKHKDFKCTTQELYILFHTVYIFNPFTYNGHYSGQVGYFSIIRICFNGSVAYKPLHLCRTHRQLVLTFASYPGHAPISGSIRTQLIYQMCQSLSSADAQPQE